MLGNSKKHILLVDSTKFDKLSPYKTCNFDDIDTLITDKMPSQDYVKVFEKNNIRLIVAE